MDDMSIYIVNLGRYTEGESVGAWFSCPVNMDEVKEKIGLNEHYEEYAIHDYKLPFEIDEYESIDTINRWCEALKNVPEYMLSDLKKLIDECGGVDFFVENLDRIEYYPGIESMEDLAMNLVEEGYYGEIPEKLRFYIDYEGIARDLDIEGHFVIGSNCIYEISW